MNRIHSSAFDLTIQSRHLAGAAALLSALLAGCSGLGGSSSLTCKLPDGARCDSVSHTYTESTRGELPGQRRRSAVEGESPSDSAPTGTSQRGSDGGVMMYTDARMTQVGMPLRSQPRIVRIWIKPWEDSDGDLHDQTFVYLSVDEGRWLVDHKQREVRDSHAPTRASANASAMSLAPVEKSVPAAQTSATTQGGKAAVQMVDAVQRAKAAQSANTSSKTEGGRSGS